MFENAINQNFEVESLLQARGNKVTAGNSTVTATVTAPSQHRHSTGIVYYRPTQHYRPTQQSEEATKAISSKILSKQHYPTTSMIEP